MKTIINKLIFTFFFLTILFVAAQPPNPGGGAGGTTPGAPSAPIDMYVYLLAVIAIMLIIFFSKRYAPKKI